MTDVGGKGATRRSWGFRWAVGFFAALLAVVAAVVTFEALRVAGDVLERPGLAGFYAQPDGALTGDPGSLIKSEELIGVPLDSRGWRLMYRSTDLNGDTVIATATLFVPLGPAPAGGRTIVSWGHPTTGSAESCAPSLGLDPAISIEGLRILLDRGYAVVATDYTGMGTTGPDSYLIGDTEGHNVLDAARAAQQVPAAHANSDVILWGHSQGGQAVLFAAQLAADYAPELSITAVAAAAPAADLSALMQTHLDDISGVTIGSYAFSAFASTYDLDLTTILTPEAIAILPQMNELCLLTHISELHEIAGPVVGKFVTDDPTTTEPWATHLQENSAGGVSFDAPLLIVQGTDDELVRPVDTAAFVKKVQSLGMDVTYETVPGAVHGTIAYLGLPDLIRFLDRVGV